MEPQEGLVDEDKTWVWPPEERLMGLLENIDPRQGSLLTCFAKKDLPILVHPNDLDYTVACHCCIYAVMPDSSFKAMVMMHLREDGKFGFPGGFAERDEDVIVALARELEEEIGLDAGRLPIGWDDFVCCDYAPLGADLMASSSMRFFFAKEVPVEEFKRIELNALSAQHFGIENFGQIRVPLHERKLRTFIRQEFAGTALRQLILTIYARKLLTIKDLHLCIDETPQENVL